MLSDLVFVRRLQQSEPGASEVPGEGGHHQPLVPVVQQLRPLHLQLELVLSHLPSSRVVPLDGLRPDNRLIADPPLLVQLLGMRVMVRLSVSLLTCLIVRLILALRTMLELSGPAPSWARKEL